MNKVITINLNGNAFQLEEPGYDILRAYLERADTQLRDNPDKAEILADLEQAIAEKCTAYLRPHKNVVMTSEVEQVVKDMGPVEDGSAPDNAARAGGAANAGAAAASAASGSSLKRLYQIREGAVISGVCNGLAAYFNVDVSLVRIGVVLLAFLSGGIVALVYLVMMFVIPVANTTEQRAAAHGAPFNAQELIDRAKKNYSEFQDKQQWKQHWSSQRQQWRQQRHEWKQHWRSQAHYWGDSMHRNMGQMAEGASYGTRILAGLMVPVLGIISAALFLALVLTIISLATTSALFGWPLPQGMPLWLGILLVVVLYNFFVWPLHALRRASYYAVGGHGYGWFAAWDGLLRVALVAFALWFGYEHVPQVRDFVDHLPQIMENFWHNVTTPRAGTLDT